MSEMDLTKLLWLEDMSSQKTESNESKKSKIGVTILKDVMKNIKLDPALITENNQILHTFLEGFITQMKYADDLFKFLFSHFYFTGSFYSDLRISEPDEFDINLVLKLPFTDSDFEVTHQFQAPSYVKYHLKNQKADFEKYPLSFKNFFEDGYLIPEKVRNWIQSVVDKARNRYKCPPGIKVVPKASGPARTILIQKSNGQIDVDLVPVIACNLNLPKGNLDGRVSGFVGSKLKAFFVPKPYSASRQMPINQKEIRLLWRSHFPDAEDTIIHNLGCVKPIIKLLKLLRDKENWKCLASYYLKTIVMWMIIEIKNTKIDENDYWKEDKMDERFIEALKKLSTDVGCHKKIPYLFNKKYNLIEKMNSQQAENIHNRLKLFIRKVEEDRYYLKNIFRL